jgi:FAD/FMN-containing dehydrogenase
MMTGSFVIDLYHINAVILNQEDMSVVVEGGAYLEEIDKALQPFHLACPVGTYFMGVGGLVLGDGSGWMSRLFGLSVNNLLECEAVLHDGTVVVPNKEGPYTVQ